jgi:N-acetylglucosaminyldiphosphoundecaprenol N-acetyl-beta-D-mannosaminyltransferase
MMSKAEIEYVRFKGIKIDNVGLKKTIEIITNNIHQKGYVCITDVRNVMYATKDKRLFNAINESLLSIPDGTPLAWYGRLLGCNTIRRVAGFDLMANMLENNNGFKHYLLGDTEQTISRVIAKARKANNNLQVAGHSPPFREHFNELENNIMCEKINSEDPDIVWVSFGGGKQDKWMHQNISKLRRGVLVGVGAAYRYYLGDLYIPPKIVQKSGMQWAVRLMGHPASIPEVIRYQSIFVFYFLIEILKNRKYITKNENEA